MSPGRSDTVELEPPEKTIPVPASIPWSFVCPPSSGERDVLKWAHDSSLFCHPGIQRMIDVVQPWFWWTTLNEDTHGYINTCLVCNQHMLNPCLSLIAYGPTFLWTFVRTYPTKCLWNGVLYIKWQTALVLSYVDFTIWRMRGCTALSVSTLCFYFHCSFYRKDVCIWVGVL